MAETDQTNEEALYMFRFGHSNKVVQVNQEQLDHFPYLVAFVMHTDDFSSAKNANGEYVMSCRIRYTWFMAIFLSIIMKQPSALFTELPQEANVLAMLQLYEFLCIKPLSIPLFKGKHLVLSNPMNDDKKRVQYHRVRTFSELRGTAVQFIIAVSKNEYNFDDSKTVQSVFSLCMVILSNHNIFGSRLCHHTLTVLEKNCYSFFSRKQQCQLYNAQQSVQRNKGDSFMYSYDDDQSLPINFQNAFAWKSVYVSTEENDSADCRSSWNKKSTNYRSTNESNFRRSMQPTEYHPVLSLLPKLQNIYNQINTYFSEYMLRRLQRPDFPQRKHYSDNTFSTREIRMLRFWNLLLREFNRGFSPYLPTSNSILYDLISLARELISEVIKITNNSESHIYQSKEQMRSVAQAARSRRFNTLVKRPNIDKFKRQFGPKAQKHR